MRAHRFDLVGCSFAFLAGTLVAGCTDGLDGTTSALGTPPAAGPDLVETAVGDPPTTALDGDSFTVSDTVQNIGTVGAGASTTKYFLSLDGTTVFGSSLLGSRSVAALAVSATDSGTATATIPAGTAQGTYFLLACADKNNAVVEANENNNCLASTGTVVVSAPDLTESAVSESPAAVDASGTLDITETTNDGTMTAAGTSTTRFYFSIDNVKSADDAFVRACVNGQATPGRTVPAISGGGSSTGTTTVPLCVRDATGLHVVTAGTYFVIACADETQLVSETNETNNCAVSAASFQVTVCGNGTLETGEGCDDGNTTSGDGCSSTCTVEAGPDLVETAVSDPPATGAPGSSFSVTDTAQNASTGVTAGASTTKYYISLDRVKSGGDLPLTGSRAVPALASLATSTGTVSVTIPGGIAGTYYVIACADANAAVAETNEANNCIASTNPITMTAADLIETAVSDPPATSFVGGTFSITDTVQNIGAAAAGTSETRYYFSLDRVHIFGSSLLGSRSVGALAVNATDTGTATATVPAGTAEGTYFVMACANKTNTVSETNTNNNCIASTGSVVISAPDLTESAVSVLPTTVVAGSSINVTETANNIGAGGAGASQTRFFVSNDNVKSSDDGLIFGCINGQALPARSVPALASNASSTGTTTIPLCYVGGAPGIHTLAPGTYFIIACADGATVISESNEKNNCTASATSFTVTP